MENPYEPPANAEVAVSVPTIPVPTTSQQVWGMFLLAIGCVVGLNVSVAVDEGIDRTIRRTTVDPYGAIAFFTIIAAVGSFGVWLWTMIRRRVFRKYYAPAPIRFVSGVLLAFFSYQILMFAERHSIDFLTAASLSLFVATIVVVECEAFVTKIVREQES
ncbi:MAG: hypothetical protein JNM43_23355 [Planctomycetaceae bacterium]|nr:hypothetical protein [Planctomycetaceae bacterium]